MKRVITRTLVREHRLILRMLAVLERNALATGAGAFSDYRFYLDGVDFIRNYADRFHHAKEEDALFEALVKNGMPRENSPVAAMLMEHDQGRAYVKTMELAALLALSGEAGQDAVIAANALAYVELLRGHIAKEDDILYPLAERLIPDAARNAVIAGYDAAEARTADGFDRRYEKIVADYEREGALRAA